MAKLGDMLVNEGLITREQLEDALQAQKSSGSFLGDVLLQRRVITDQQLADVLARQTGAPPIDLAAAKLDPTLAKMISVDVARRHRVIPVRQNAKVLHVAMVNPQDDQAIDSIGFQSGCTIKALVTTQAALEAAWGRLYGGAAPASEPAATGPAAARKSAAGRKPLQALPDLKALDTILSESLHQIIGAADVKREDAEEGEIVDLEPRSDEHPVVRMVNALLIKAVQMRASDIHIEPQEKIIQVRFRIDGAMVPVAEFPAHTRQALLGRIKILSKMDISERRIPQDGRIKVRLTESQAIDFRVNSLPAVHGEKIVLRILGQGQLSDNVEALGFVGRNLEHVKEAIRNPFGMLLVTGPTGSGKTTTLYTILRQLNQKDVNILTAEDPVEYQLAGITQVNVRSSIGFTFEVALRAFLRQDPDVILVGEIRDYETAAIATKAALTGHLVLSTLHTNDCPSTVVRLVDMGIEPYLVASAVKLVIAQRLIRRICPGCKEELAVDQAEREDLSQSSLAQLEHMYHGKGCDQCNGLGFHGRSALYEVMPVRSKEMKRIVTEGGTEIQVAQVARREGIRSLRDEALRLVNDGVTSLEEAIEIIMAD